MTTPELQALVRGACDAEARSRHTECGYPNCMCELRECKGVLIALIEAARAEEREKVAAFMGVHSLATGHGDTIEGLLVEMGWQIGELRSRAVKAAGE